VILGIFCLGAGLDLVIGATPAANVTNEFQRSLDELREGVDVEEGGGLTFLLFLRTLVVLAVLLLGFFFLMRFLSRKKTAAGKDNYFRVLALFPLGQNRFLEAVKLGSTFYLLGISEGSVSLVEKIGNKEIQDELLLQESRKGVDGGFGSYLGKILGDRGGSLGRSGEKLRKFLKQ